MQLWFDLVEKFKKIELSVEQKMDESLNFNEFASNIWKKYMQVAFFDMADDLKIEALRLDSEYF